MRKPNLFPPFLLLAVLLGLSLLNSFTMTNLTVRWQEQLWQADAFAQSENWTDATAAVAESYQDWSRRQAYLHIVTEHDVVDDAEAMYQRALAFAATREPSEFRAELADLRSQLHLLSETERLSLKNVL